MVPEEQYVAGVGDWRTVQSICHNPSADSSDSQLSTCLYWYMNETDNLPTRYT